MSARGRGRITCAQSLTARLADEAMASQAQIDANKRNSQRSTGPKSETGKARAKLNALKDGSHAKTVRRVLPQENAVELNDRIDRWIIDLKPRNDAERELVALAAELAWTLDRAKRLKLVNEIDRKLQADGARLILGWGKQYAVHWPRVKAYPQHENSIFNVSRLQDVWLDK